MRALRNIHYRIQGRILGIATIAPGRAPLWTLSAIIGAYLSVQLAPGIAG